MTSSMETTQTRRSFRRVTLAKKAELLMNQYVLLSILTNLELFLMVR